MRKYSLRLSDNPMSEARRIEFEATDPSAALRIAEDHGYDRPMELWEGELLLGTIRSMNGFWSLSKA